MRPVLEHGPAAADRRLRRRRVCPLPLSLFAAETALALEGAGDTIQLFRHVDPIELEDIRATGEFRLGPNSRGKYFAETAEHAEQWGQMLNNGERAVVATNVPWSVADQLFTWEKLDGIGPARFVSPEPLDWFNPFTEGIREIP